MFSTHNINTNNFSIKNLILLFLTIVFGFASVITLAQIDILSDIENARQTIAKITITADGTNSQTYIEMSSGGIFIHDDVMQQEYNFTGKVLGIDDSGNLIYVMSQSLVVSGVSGGAGGGDGLWTGVLGGDIYNINSGKVGIGTNTPTGKLHIVSSGETDVYIQEQAVDMAASLRLVPPLGPIRIVGGDSNPNIFFIGIVGHQEYFAMNTSGYVGIGLTGPTVPLQISGSIIGGKTNNTITNSPDGSILGGNGNSLSGGKNFSILAGEGNRIISKDIGGCSLNNSIMGGQGNSIYTNGKGQGYDHIVGGQENTISGEVNYSTIGGGNSNKIYSSWSFIGGGNGNTITGSSRGVIGGGAGNTISISANAHIGGGDGNTISASENSFIPGGASNTISGSPYSFAAGIYAKIINKPNSFVRNSEDNSAGFSAYKPKSFIINVPMTRGDIGEGGVGINTNNPKTPLDVNGLIRTREITGTVEICTTSIKGAIGFYSGHFWGCNGSSRIQLDN